jgi:hypothetical protein
MRGGQEQKGARGWQAHLLLLLLERMQFVN